MHSFTTACMTWIPPGIFIVSDRVMEIAAAASLATSAVSLFGACKDLISSIISGVEQVQQNNTKALNCFMKARFLAKLTEKCEERYEQCYWLDHVLQDELATKLEYIESLLKRIKSLLPTNQKKRKWFKAGSDREFIDQLEGLLKEVDNELGKLSKEIDQILARPRCPSSAVSEVDHPLPSKVTDLRAKQEGKYVVVSWKDCTNSAENVLHYNIYIDDNVWDVYDPHTSSSIDSSEHSVRMTTTFDPWHLYFVTVSAVNKASQEGQRSSPVQILMNACPPDIKPMGLKVLTALSRKSVILSVNCPENFNEMAISKCKIQGFADGTIQITREANFLENQGHRDNLLFEVTDIEPMWNCRVAVTFSNDYGEGIRSDEIRFQINSMRPSKPNLSLIENSSNSVKVEISTETNPGNVLGYQLYKRQGSKGKKEREGVPIIQQGSDPINYTINDLQPRKKYHFFVVSESAMDQSTLESDILKVKTPAA